MKKLKLFFAALALLVGGANSASAQNYEDVTSTALLNPSFEFASAGTPLSGAVASDAAPYGWTISTGVQSKISDASTTTIEFTNGAGGVTPKEGTYFYESKVDWAYGSRDGSISTTTNSLEAGLYYVEFSFKAADICNNDKWENGTALGITVRDASSNNLVDKAKVRVAYSLSNAGGGTGSDTFLAASQWDRMGAIFNLSSAGAVTIIINQTLMSRAHSEILYDNFKLYKINQSTTGASVDVSGVINNANFATKGKLNWTDASNNIALGGLVSNYCAERWNQTFNLSQNITGLPNGKYKVAVQAFYRAGDQGTTTTTQNAILFAGTDEQPVLNILSGGQATSGSGYSKQAGSVWVPNSMDDASIVFSAGAYSDNYVTTIVSDGTKNIGIKKTVGIGNDWTLFDNFQLFLVSPAIQYVAEAFPVGGSLTADKWYYYDVAFAKEYKFTTADLSKVVFTQDGTQNVEDAATAVTANPTAVEALSVGKVYVKASEDLVLAIAPNTYSYSVGAGTSSVEDGKYTQSETLTVTFAAATTDDPDGALSIIDASKIKVNSVAATASIEGKVLTITVASPLATSTDYAVSIEAGAVGYNVDNTNAAISLTAKTPAVFDGAYFISDGTKYVSRGGESNTEAILDEYGIAVEISTDAENVSLVKFVDANLYLYAGQNSVYTDKTIVAGGDNVKWTIAAYSDGYSFLTGRDRSSELNPGNYIVAGVGYESSKEAATYDESAYAWKLEDPATHATKVAAYKDANAAAVATDAGLSAATVTELKTIIEGAGWVSENVAVTDAIASTQEKYQFDNSETPISENLTGLKDGIYKVKLSVFKRIAGNADTYNLYNKNQDSPTAYLFAGDNKAQVPSVMSEYSPEAYTEGWDPNYAIDGKNFPNSKGAAGQAFNAGRYTLEVFAYVDGGSLNIGLKNPAKYANSNWLCYRDLVVTRYYPGVSATIGATGWTTFASPFALDLSSLDGATAYYASDVDGETVTMTSTDQAAVQAGEGIMLKGTANAEIIIPVVASGTNISGNLLVGCTSATDITDATPNYADIYVLGIKSETTDVAEFQNVKNYIYNDGGDSRTVSIPAGKAYLKAPALSARGLRIVIADDVTGINEAQATGVEAVVKEGKFIEKGKLFIFKNGKKYNANGQMVK